MLLRKTSKMSLRLLGDAGIDSIDVLELVMMIEKDYGVKIDSKELGAKVFASVRALATFYFNN